MIILGCAGCNLLLRTSGEHDEVDFLLGTRSDFYPDKYQCPRCESRLVLSDSVDSELLAVSEVRDLTPQEVFAALNGLGLPEERDCGADAIRRLLVGKKIVNASLQQLRGTNRSVIYSLELEDGRILYLGASPVGAVAYRIRKKTSYVQETLSE